MQFRIRPMYERLKLATRLGWWAPRSYSISYCSGVARNYNRRPQTL